jgi:hypothetical protein
MLNKPIILSIIISLVFLGAVFATSLIRNNFGQFLLILIILLGFSLFMGKSHAKNFREEIPKKNKIKIALYYFMFYFILFSSVILIMVRNTTVKGLPLYSTNPTSITILLSVLLMIFTIFGIYGFVIYYALGLGCKLELSKIASNNEQESEPPSQA